MSGEPSSSSFLDMSGCGICVTGGAGHLGRAIAAALAGAGATVLIVARTADSLAATQETLRDAPGAVHSAVADMRRDDDQARVIAHLAELPAEMTGWVNNAYSGAGGLLPDYTRAQVEATMGSLVDAMMCTQRFAHALISRGLTGSIVNVASMYGMVSPEPSLYDQFEHFHNPPAYGAMKAGLLQFTRYAAVHLGRQGVRVNAVSPGPFPSDEVQRETGFVERLADASPMGRIGQPSEVAGAVRFLLSDQATYVNGHNLVVDGGWTAR